MYLSLPFCKFSSAVGKNNIFPLSTMRCIVFAFRCIIIPHATNCGGYNVFDRSVSQSVSQSVSPVFLVSTTPLKLLNRISWNFVVMKDIMCRCAYPQEMLIWSFWGAIYIPFFVRLPITNAWNCHSLYTAFSSTVGAWGLWASSLFLSFISSASPDLCQQINSSLTLSLPALLQLVWLSLAIRHIPGAEKL